MNVRQARRCKALPQSWAWSLASNCLQHRSSHVPPRPLHRRQRMVRASGGELSSAQVLAFAIQAAQSGWTTESVDRDIAPPDFEDWMRATMSVMAFFIGAVPEEGRTEMLIQLAAAFTPLGQSMRMDNAASHSAGGATQ